MVIYRFPPESNGESTSQQSFNKQPGKTPDFIYVDDVPPHKKQRGSSESEALFSVKTRYPFFLRFLTLLVASVLTAWVGVLIGLLLIVTAMGAVLFFQSPSTINAMGRLWESIGRFSAYALALFVATLNPSFGFGIFALYALQHGKDSMDMPFEEVFKGRF